MEQLSPLPVQIHGGADVSWPDQRAMLAFGGLSGGSAAERATRIFTGSKAIKPEFELPEEKSKRFA
ncbi:MAG TPA: hypothetical protein VN155_06380 [Devosia sp.]|nr:hypothetical protein [Devosia sp.]